MLTLIDILNNVQSGTLDDEVQPFVQAKLVKQNNSGFVDDSLHIFATFASYSFYVEKLKASSNPLRNIPALNIKPTNASSRKISEMLNLSQSNIGGVV